MTSLPPRADGVPHIDAYLDGMMSPAERSAFEAALRTDKDLAAEFALQGKIDSGLREMLPYQPAAPIPISAAPRPWLQRPMTWLSVAAAVLLALTAFTYLSRGPDFKLMGADALYAKLESKGFTPEWKCKDDVEFASTIRNRLGQALVVPAAATDATILGWAYANVYDGSPISPDTMILMAKAQGKNVIVLFDKTSQDRRVKVPESSGLHVYRREVQGLVLYEVSPLDQPHVLDAVRPPA